MDWPKKKFHEEVMNNSIGFKLFNGKQYSKEDIKEIYLEFFDPPDYYYSENILARGIPFNYKLFHYHSPKYTLEEFVAGCENKCLFDDAMLYLLNTCNGGITVAVRFHDGHGVDCRMGGYGFKYEYI